jgi:hypothetical protein
MQWLFSRSARGRFWRLPSALSRAICHAGLCPVAGALALGLLVPSLIAGQQGEKKPAAKNPAGGERERAANDGPPAPVISSRTVEYQLEGALERPVFFDVDTGCSFTPPPDLVPAEERGKSIEKWVWSEPLITWISSQGIDFAVQTDNWTHVSVVGFDVRTGEPLPAGDQRLRSDAGPLDPSFFVTMIKPSVMGSVIWNFTKNKSEFVPFVTREGSLGLFTVALQPFDRRRALVEFEYKLSREPNVAKLTGQPLLPVFESPLLGWSPRVPGPRPNVLIADVIAQKLRLRLLDSPYEIVVGGGEVVVHGPSGATLRAARLGGGWLKFDGAKDIVTIVPNSRDSVTALRRVGPHVQIETDGRVAETAQLELKFPEFKLANAASLTWKPSQQEAIRRRARTISLQNRQRSQAEAARFLAEMARHGYALEPSQSVRHVAPPFPAVRAEYWWTSEPMFYFPMANRTSPEAVTYEWDGKELHQSAVSIEPFRLMFLVDALHRIKQEEIRGPADLLGKPLPGDWVARPDAPNEVFARDLEAILRRDLRLPIHLEFRDERRDVYVARGRFHFTPLTVEAGKTGPNAAKQTERTPAIKIFGKRMYSGPGSGGGGSGNFKECLNWVGRWIETPIVNEVTDTPDEVTWRLQADFRRKGQPEENEDRDPALVLANIERQTGIHFTKERRPVKILFVEKKE